MEEAAFSGLSFFQGILGQEVQSSGFTVQSSVQPEEL
jgi:hypothetical protein